MVTNVKKYNYSIGTKLICIFLSMICALSATLLTTAFVLQKSFEQNNLSLETYTSQPTVASRFNSDLFTVLAYTNMEQAKDAEMTLLMSQKDEACEAVYNELSDYIQSAEANDYAEDYWSASYYIGSITEKCSYSLTNDFYVDVTSDNSSIFTKEYIETLYDTFVTEAVSNFETEITAQYTNITGNKNINWYITDGSEVWQSSDTQQNDITKAKYYVAIESGEITNGNNFDEQQLSDISEMIAPVDFDENYTALVSINLDESNVYSFYYSLLSLLDTMFINDIVTVSAIFVLIAVFFASTAYYAKICGKKSEDDKAKRIFIDYIFLEIQIVAVAGLIFGAYALFTLYTGFDYDFSLTLYILSFCILAIWFLLFELTASISRYAKSGENFKNHLLFYRTFALCKKASKNIGESLGVLTYKPKTFARNIILISIAVALLILIDICAMAYSLYDNFFLFIILLILSIIGIIKLLSVICRYFKYLDEIIYASQNHSEIDADYEKMPNSLKILTDSMKYKDEELQTAIAQAIKDERLRAELITNVSHDLKTPLTSIINYVSLLKNSDIKDEKALEYIDVLDDKGGKLKRLIDDLIEASKVTSGNVTVNLSPMNLSELCLQSTIDVTPDFEKENLTLVVKQGENVIVTADGSKSFRVIENLLSNAKKYSAKGSRVYVNVYEDGSNGVFEIKNISAQPLDITPDELTQRFVRGDKSRTQDGNGLGLSIAKELCILQNGLLEITIDGDLFKAKMILPKKQNND